MPKEFQIGSRYQGYAQTQGFNPIKPPDVTPLLRENRQAEQNNLQRMLDQSMSVMRINDQEERNALQRQNDIAKIVRDFELDDLTEFSQTLTNAITGYQKYRQEKDIEAGMALAYTDGLPEDAIRQFKETEQKAEEAATISEGVAASLEAEDAPTDIVSRARNLSGWKAYGYARGIAQLGGQQYAVFYEEAAERVKIPIGGRLVTLANAKDSSERAAVEAEIRRQYLKNFEGMNLGLLNEYLFPAMKQYEAKAATSFAIEMRERLQAERKTTLLDEMAGYVKNNNAGEGFIKLINLHQYDFGGRGKTREVLIQELKDGLASGRYKPEQIEALLDYEFDKDGNGKLVKVRKAFERQFEDFDELIRQAKRGEIEDANEDRKLRMDAFVQDLRDRVEKRGEPLNEGERLHLMRQSLKMFDQIPEYLQTYTTLEDLDKTESKRRADYLLASKGFISTAEARTLHPSVAANFMQQGKVKDTEIMTSPKEKEAFKELTGRAKDAFRAAGEITGGEKENRFLNNLKEAYRTEYATAVMTAGVESPEQAHDIALKRVLDRSRTDNYGGLADEPTISIDEKKVENYKKAATALQNDTSIYQPLPGLESALQQLQQYQRRGKSTLPFEFKQLAQGLGGISGWDLAAAQYAAHGYGQLNKPKVEQDVDKMTPLVRGLLRDYNTPSRTLRAQIETKDAPFFLELVKNKESKAYGEYDAMNTGGSNRGHTAHGSANSKDVFDKPLTQMTIGEVMELQAQGKLFAAGAYQIIPGTMRGIFPSTGLSKDDLFDKAAQDKLALALYRRRVTWHGTNKYNLMSGLRNEWIGLQYVEDDVLLKSIEGMSPYNQPQNVLPALRGGK